MANYPGALPTLTNPTSGDTLAAVPHAAQHASANDEIEAIATELGVNPRGASATVVARLEALDATVAGKAALAHASRHQHGGADEVATATPGANAVPKAGAAGTLGGDWLPSPGSLRVSAGYGLPSATHIPHVVTTQTLVADSLTATPFQSAIKGTITEAVIEVTSASASGVCDIVLYACTIGSDGQFVLGSLLATLGRVSTATTGVKTLSGLSVAIRKGDLYAIGVSLDQTCTLRVGSGPDGIARTFTGGVNAYLSVQRWGVISGGFPAPSTGPTMLVVASASATAGLRIFAMLNWSVP